VRGPFPYAPAGREGGESSGWGRAWEVEHSASRAQKRVYVELTAAGEKTRQHQRLPEQLERALAADGRGAVEAYLNHAEPPDLITISEETVGHVLYPRLRPLSTAA
jgi:hypothetical protein